MIASIFTRMYLVRAEAKFHYLGLRLFEIGGLLEGM